MPELPTSVVERLRNDEVRQGPDADPLCIEAANIIEALVGALRDARGVLDTIAKSAVAEPGHKIRSREVVAKIDEALALTSIDRGIGHE